MIGPANHPSVRCDDVILDATVYSEIYITSAAAIAGEFRTRSYVPNPITNERGAKIPETSDEKRAANPLVRLLFGLDLDDARLHVDVMSAVATLSHRDTEFAGSVSILDGRAEGFLERRSLEGEKRFGGGEATLDPATRQWASGLEHCPRDQVQG
jgi:hypothetical protein